MAPGWKKATIVSVVVLMAVVITGVALVVAMVHDSTVVRRAARMAVGNHPAPPRPTPRELPLPPTGTPEFRQFGADLVVRLERAGRGAGNVPVPPACMRTVRTAHSGFGNNNAWVLASTDGSQTWVVFRGTATKDEWDKDFQLTQTPMLSRMLSRRAGRVMYPHMAVSPQSAYDDTGVSVHSGFLEVYQGVRDSVESAVRESPGRTLCIVGHSLGGALAQIAALDLCTNLPARSTHVLVFGSPRTGNPEFGARLAALPTLINMDTVVNTCDVVPNLPLAVQPIIKPPNEPAQYAHPTVGTKHSFTVNHGSWTSNHTMRTYVDYIDQQINDAHQ